MGGRTQRGGCGSVGRVSKLLWVGLGGFVGSVLRFAISGALHRLPASAAFPWGTLVVNVLGCGAIGLVGAWLEARELTRPELRLFVVIGLLGGFTTFSTFGYETLALARQAGFGRMALNVVANVALCLIAVLAGERIGRALL